MQTPPAKHAVAKKMRRVMAKFKAWFDCSDVNAATATPKQVDEAGNVLKSMDKHLCNGSMNETSSAWLPRVLDWAVHGRTTEVQCLALRSLGDFFTQMDPVIEEMQAKRWDSKQMDTLVTELTGLLHPSSHPWSVRESVVWVLRNLTGGVTRPIWFRYQTTEALLAALTPLIASDQCTATERDDLVAMLIHISVHTEAMLPLEEEKMMKKQKKKTEQKKSLRLVSRRTGITLLLPDPNPRRHVDAIERCMEQATASLTTMALVLHKALFPDNDKKKKKKKKQTLVDAESLETVLQRLGEMTVPADEEKEYLRRHAMTTERHVIDKLLPCLAGVWIAQLEYPCVTEAALYLLNQLLHNDMWKDRVGLHTDGLVEQLFGTLTRVTHEINVSSQRTLGSAGEEKRNHHMRQLEVEILEALSHLAAGSQELFIKLLDAQILTRTTSYALIQGLPARRDALWILRNLIIAHPLRKTIDVALLRKRILSCDVLKALHMAASPKESNEEIQSLAHQALQAVEKHLAASPKEIQSPALQAVQKHPKESNEEIQSPAHQALQAVEKKKCA